MNSNGNPELIDVLVQSPVFRDYERSFSEATGLPVALVAPESWQLPFRGHRQENRFCALLSSCNRSCAACLRAQEQLTTGAGRSAHTITCAAGLCETAVPVRNGEQLIGFLRTGQVFRHPPTPKQSDRMIRLAQRWGLPVDEHELRAAYFDTPVLPARRHDSVVMRPGLLDKAVVREGSPYHEITAAARRLKADLIVIATHGRSGLSRVFLGSTAERVVRHAPCPVLTVPRR